MCAEKHESKPGLLWSILANRCPRCRRGPLFTHPNPYALRTTMRMPERCPVCGQPYELQTGFYFGTGYVSYGLSIAVCVASAILWQLTLGFSITDNSIFWWLGVNTLLLILLQPLLQRWSRAIWIAFFVRYDKNWRQASPEGQPAAQ